MNLVPGNKMKETYTYRIKTVNSNTKGYRGFVFYVKASSEAEAIEESKPMIKPGYVIETIEKRNISI
jgi:hypothetical protein